MDAIAPINIAVASVAVASIAVASIVQGFHTWRGVGSWTLHVLLSAQSSFGTGPTCYHHAVMTRASVTHRSLSIAHI